MPKFTTIATTLEADKIAEVGAVIHNINSTTGAGFHPTKKDADGKPVSLDGQPHETHDCQPISFAYERVKPKSDSDADVKTADETNVARRDAAKRLLAPGVRANVGDYYCEFKGAVLIIPGPVFEALTSK